MHELLRYSHVCRYWRRAFDVFPRLSTILILPSVHGVHPSAHQYNLVHLFLSRSGTHPLEIHIPHRGLIDVVVQQSHRLKHLQMDLSLDPFLQKENTTMLKYPAPQLEYFDYSAFEESKAYRPYSHFFSLPVVFDGQLPHLRRLKLVGFSSWTGNVFHHLTHICLVGFRSLSRPSLREILDLLHNNPSVEELYLSHFTASSIEDMAQPTVVRGKAFEAARLAKLARLRRLSLSQCNHPEVGAMFAFSHLPQGANLFLSCSKYSTVNQGFQDIFVQRQSHFDNMVDLHLLSLNCTRHEVMAAGPSGSVRILDGVDMWSRFHAPCPTHTLTELWVEGEFAVATKKSIWKDILASLPALEKISANSWFTKSIVDALCSPPVGVPPSPVHVPQTILCERLQILSLTEMWNSGKVSVPFSAVLRCVQSRSARGLPIHHLKICSDTNPSALPSAMARAAWPLDSWSDNKVTTLRQYVNLVEYGVEYERIPVPSEFAERTHPQYWPQWS